MQSCRGAEVQRCRGAESGAELLCSGAGLLRAEGRGGCEHLVGAQPHVAQVAGSGPRAWVGLGLGLGLGRGLGSGLGQGWGWS